jgi:ribosomal protein S18 acetylase RimI-like enzyme
MCGYDGHRGWLYSLAVHPSSRNNGHGTRLVRHAEAALAERGCLKVNLQILETNRSVVQFYRRLGYCAEPRISMGRRLGRERP